MNAPKLALWEGSAVVVAMEAAPPTIKQTSSMPAAGACTCITHHPHTYHGGGTRAVWPGDILPSAFRDHGLNSEGVSGGLVRSL